MSATRPRSDWRLDGILGASTVVLGRPYIASVALANILEVDGAQDARRAVARMGGLVSQADLARRWGFSRQRVHQVAREPGFPAPAGFVNGQATWLAAEADRWLEHRALFLAEASLSAG